MGLALVLVTHADGAPDDVSLQALTFARGFAAGDPVHAVMIGAGAAANPAGLGAYGAAANPAGLGAYGAATAHVADHPSLTSFAPDAWARIVVDLADRLGAGSIIGAGSDAGNDVLARAAARLHEPFSANCIAGTAGDPSSVTRVRWGGSLLEEARLHADRAVLTVAPHSIPVQATGGSATVESFTPALDDADLVVRVRERIAAAAGGISLTDARVVVTGGRGVGSPEGFRVIEELAATLGAAVGCTRAVTIAGWRSHTEQVGQTGTKIAPDVYIACGVSGATQHMAGCKGAKAILAINKDREAPIMLSADYAVVGDLHQVVPAIAAEIRRVRGA